LSAKRRRLVTAPASSSVIHTGFSSNPTLIIAIAFELSHASRASSTTQASADPVEPTSCMSLGCDLCGLSRGASHQPGLKEHTSGPSSPL
jgi:hypothetical protein